MIRLPTSLDALGGLRAASAPMIRVRPASARWKGWIWVARYTPSTVTSRCPLKPTATTVSTPTSAEPSATASTPSAVSTARGPRRSPTASRVSHRMGRLRRWRSRPVNWPIGRPRSTSIAGTSPASPAIATESGIAPHSCQGARSSLSATSAIVTALATTPTASPRSSISSSTSQAMCWRDQPSARSVTSSGPRPRTATYAVSATRSSAPRSTTTKIPRSSAETGI